MAIYTSLLEPSVAQQCIEHDVAFLHPNQTVKDAIFLYCIAIHHLVNNPNDPDRAKKAFNVAFERSESMKSYICSKSGLENSPKIWLERSILLHSQAEEADVLVKKPLDERIINCRNLIGWLERAFVLSFYYLLRHSKYVECKKEADMYVESIRQVIQEGGDTDTNACIAGGMIGAIVGIKAIPDFMVQKLIKFDCEHLDNNHQFPGI